MNKEEWVYLVHFLFSDGSGEEEVAGVLKMAAVADRICRLKYSEGEYVQDVCLQVHKDRTLVSGIKGTDSFVYELKEPAEIKRACYYLLNCFEITEPVNEEAPALLISKRKYEELKKKASTYTLYFLEKCLAAATGDLSLSSQLARVMKCSTADGELRFCSRQEEGWSFQQAFFIEDDSGGWLLRMSRKAAEDWMIAVPMTKAQLCSVFYKWILCSSSVINSE